MGSTLYSKRYHPGEGRNRKVRPKTFESAEKAKAWADANKVKKYQIVPMAYSSKVKLVI
jgi:hypothetical protein